jgi:23S rRNA pseudouridine2604 synthase
MADEPKIRINRFFTDNGVMSRREADRAVTEGRIKINDRVAVLGDKVGPEDTISLDGRNVQTGRKRPVILAYNKPVGVECTSDQRVENNIIDAVDYPERVFHIGRLDKYSEGLILLTNMGDIVNKILRSRYEHEKEYIVDTDEPISDRAIATLAGGIRLDDGKTKPCEVERLNQRRIRLILTEGRNRQIRRMIQHVDLKVVRLRRIRIINIELGKLPVGEWRKLTKDETQKLLQSLDSKE